MERHRLDPLSLVGGLVLVAAGLVGFFGSIDIGLEAWQYVGPLVLIAIGAVLVLAAPWSRQDREEEGAARSATPDEPAAAETAETADAAEVAEDPDATAELPSGDDEEGSAT